MILVLGKAKRCGAPNLAVGGWVTWVIGCLTKNLCTRRDAWVQVVLWWSWASPVAHSCGLLNHPHSFQGGMFKLMAKFDIGSLLYSLMCGCWMRQPHSTHVHSMTPTTSLTSTVKLLFTHAHSSPLSLAARLHQCHTNHSLYINNDWTFPRQSSYF